MTRVTTCKMMINGDHLQDHFAQVQMISGKMKQIEGVMNMMRAASVHCTS